MPAFWPFLVMALVILVFSFTAKFALAKSHTHDPNRRATLIRIGILLLPLLYLGGGYGASLGSFALSKRQVSGLPGMIRPGAGGRHEPAAAGESGAARERDLLDLVMSAMQFGPQGVNTLGQVSLDDTLPEDCFILFRFVITCCVADAQPVAVLVRFQDHSSLKDDAWIRVRGVMEMDKVEGEDAMVITAESMEPAEEPDEIYLYGLRY
jgi:uncharacterized repeat protein (TIGR03943 family)